MQFRLIAHFPNADVVHPWVEFDDVAFLLACAGQADAGRGFTVEFNVKSEACHVA